MADLPVPYGFDGSTYVRTVRIILAKIGIACEHVLAGETRTPDHLARHPPGKVPVLDIDGMRLRETEAFRRYLDDRTPEPSVVPADARDRARMTEVVSMIGSDGYGAMLGGVAAYHLFPDVVGGKDEEARAQGLKDAWTLLALIKEIEGDAPWVAGDRPSIAGYLLGPPMVYLALTPDAADLLAIPGLAAWREAIGADPHVAGSAPSLGRGRWGTHRPRRPRLMSADWWVGTGSH